MDVPFLTFGSCCTDPFELIHLTSITARCNLLTMVLNNIAQVQISILS